LRIEFELKFRDFFLFNVIHQFRSVTVQLFMALGPLLMVCLADDGDAIGITAVTAIVAYLAMWLGQLIFLAIYLWTGNNRTLLTHRVVELQQDALFEESRFSKCYYYWSGIHKTVLFHGTIGIYVTAQSAYLIPKRAFPNDIACEKFWTALNLKIAERAQAPG
jgi:hypothetical protein